MAFGTRLQRPNRILGVGVRAMGPALFSVLHARFQEVADFHLDLLADALRNHDLKLRFYGDDVHDGMSSSSTVEQYNRGGRLSRTPIPRSAWRRSRSPT